MIQKWNRPSLLSETEEITMEELLGTKYPTHEERTLSSEDIVFLRALAVHPEVHKLFPAASQAVKTLGLRYDTPTIGFLEQHFPIRKVTVEFVTGWEREKGSYFPVEKASYFPVEEALHSPSPPFSPSFYNVFSVRFEEWKQNNFPGQSQLNAVNRGVEQFTKMIENKDWKKLIFDCIPGLSVAKTADGRFAPSNTNRHFAPRVPATNIYTTIPPKDVFAPLDLWPQNLHRVVYLMDQAEEEETAIWRIFSQYSGAGDGMKKPVYLYLHPSFRIQNQERFSDSVQKAKGKVIVIADDDHPDASLDYVRTIGNDLYSWLQNTPFDADMLER